MSGPAAGTHGRLIAARTQLRKVQEEPITLAGGPDEEAEEAIRKLCDDALYSIELALHIVTSPG